MANMSMAIPFVLLIVMPILADDVSPGMTAFGGVDLTLAGDMAPQTMGCGTNVSALYTGGFDPQHFEWVNVDVDKWGYMSLKF